MVVETLPGKYVDEFVIQDNRTIPKTISNESVAVELNITVRQVFLNYKLSGNLNVEGTTYKISSWDRSSSGFVASISEAPMKRLGMLRLSDDLKYYLIKQNNKDLIIGPAETVAAAEEAVHYLYGG